ncbi:MAG: alpha/beta hydrolase [Desulfamplus sp.]|nr:alpha/beta hydrolase [Desulfamplus sp.]
MTEDNYNTCQEREYKHHKQNDNYQEFNFNFFTSQDNQQIRWGGMRAARECSKSEIFKTDIDLNGINTTSNKSEGIIFDSDETKTNRAQGIVLLLNGRTEFMEKYTQVASRLALIGYHVMSLDWRGQGLSVRELPNRDKGYVKNFNLYVKDLEIFYNLHVLPLSKSLNLPITILAHSMGGHIALRFLSECSNCSSNSNRISSHTALNHTDSNSISINIDTNIKKAILISPMIDIITSPIKGNFVGILADWATRQLACLAVKAKFEAHYVPNGKDYCREDVKFEGNVLTHDWDNFWLEHREIAKNRNLALGGVTWGWLKAAFDSIELLKDEKYLSRIKTPVSIFSAEQDRVVSNSAQKSVCQTITKGKLISIPKARHEILFETEEIREVLWKDISLEI